MSDKVKTYEVASLLQHDGKEFEAGSTIPLTDAQAEPLLRVGTLHPLGDDGAEASAPAAPSAPPAGDDDDDANPKAGGKPKAGGNPKK